MSSVVIFEKAGVVANWNKGAPYSVDSPLAPRRFYATESKAIAAAKRKAKRIETETRKAFEDAFFQAHHTGGGCMAWQWEIDDSELEIWVTDTSGTDLFSYDGNWLVGVHSIEGEESCVMVTGIAAAIAKAGELEANLKGRAK